VNRALLLLAATVGLLFAAERGLTRRADDARARRGTVGRFVSVEEREAMPIAAVKIEVGGRSFLYARYRGDWRILDFHRAFADGGGLESLVQKLTEARGFVVSDVPAEAEAYGIGTRETVRVSLCGAKVLEEPDGDVLAAFDVGATVEGGGCFARRRGSKEVWSLDVDPSPELTPRTSGLPPLAEARVVPGAWPGWGRGGLVRIFVDHADGSGFELAKSDAPPSPEEMAAGGLPWSWNLIVDGEAATASSLPAHGYTLFLQRAPIVALLDPAQKDEVLGQAATTLTLVAPDVPALALEIGPPSPRGRVAVWNPWAESLAIVEADAVPLLVPRPEDLASDVEENLWDAFLRASAPPPAPR